MNLREILKWMELNIALNNQATVNNLLRKALALFHS